MPVPVGLLFTQARERSGEDLRTVAKHFSISHTYLRRIELCWKFCFDLPLKVQKNLYKAVFNYIKRYLPEQIPSLIDNEDLGGVYIHSLFSRDKFFMSDLGVFFGSCYVDEPAESKPLETLGYSRFFTELLCNIFVFNGHSSYLLKTFNNSDIHYFIQLIFDRVWGSKATYRSNIRKIYDYSFECTEEGYVFHGDIVTGVLAGNIYKILLLLILKKICISTDTFLGDGLLGKWVGEQEIAERLKLATDFLVLELPSGTHTVAFCAVSGGGYGNYFEIISGDITNTGPLFR